MNYVSSPVADEVVIVYAVAVLVTNSRRISVRIVEIPQSTASAECFILQAVANIVIFVLQTNIGNSFRCSQSVNVISKANIYRSELHRRKLSAVLPCERVTPVCQRISYRIVGYRCIAVCRQLVLPVAVAVGICRIVSVAVTPLRLPHVSGYTVVDRILPPLSARLYPHHRKRSPSPCNKGRLGEFLCFYSLSRLRASSPGGGAHT